MALDLKKDGLTRNLAKKTKFAYHLDRVIGEGDFVWEYNYEPKEDDKAWHPSGHCTPSLAELYHIAKGNAPEDKISASLYKTFQVGHFWHQYLQWVTVHKLGFAAPAAVERRGMKGWGDTIHSGERRGKDVFHYRDFHWATGSGDLAPVYLPTYGEFLVDFKTMGSHDFRKNGVPDWCADKYECQINIYMDFFDLDRGLIVAILKDSPHDFKEFEFHRNQPLIDAIYMKWELVSKCLEEGIEPPIDEEIYLPLEGPRDV
jgi:hypothetical protein